MKRLSPTEIWLFVFPLLIVLSYGLVHRGDLTPPPASVSPPSPTPTLPPVVNWSFKMQHARVAAGAIPNPVHQSVFVIRALDPKGQPLAGVAVELPQVWNDGTGQAQRSSKHSDEPKEIFPHVQWFTPGNITRIDKRGEVHGLFTSGSRAEPAVLSGPGETQVAVEQIVR